jgi:hypothetical protein
VPIAFDTTGLHQHDPTAWIHPASSDQITSHYLDVVPNLPAALDDLPAMRHQLALECADVGCLVEAHIVSLGGVPALFQIVKVPLPNAPAGQVFIATFTVPRANSSAMLKYQAMEQGMTGVREAMLVTEVGFDNWVQPHPYAPELQGRLPFHVGDDARWDARFPDHPLSRCRAWAHHVARTGRVDPRFAALPEFRPAPPRPAEPEIGGVLTTVVPGVPIAGYLPLWHNDNEVSFWRMTEPDAVLEKLGVGALSRMPLLEKRFRDLVALDPSSSSIMLTNRYRGEDGSISGPLAQLERVSAQEAYAALTVEAVAEAFTWIGRLAEAAAGRGEYVCLEPGGVTYRPEPYVLMIVQERDGRWLSIVETAPVPEGAPIWRDQRGPDDVRGQTVSGAAEPEIIRAGGHLAMQAATTWEQNPFQLALSFGPSR